MRTGASRVNAKPGAAGSSAIAAAVHFTNARRARRKTEKYAAMAMLFCRGTDAVSKACMPPRLPIAPAALQL
jgi:hypothetical protein